MKSRKEKGLFVVFLVLLGILMTGLLFQGIFLTTMSNTVKQAQAEGVDTMLARQGWFQVAGWITWSCTTIFFVGSVILLCIFAVKGQAISSKWTAFLCALANGLVLLCIIPFFFLDSGYWTEHLRMLGSILGGTVILSVVLLRMNSSKHKMKL